MSTQQTLQQQRAASAWKDVAAVKGKSHADDYLSLVRGLPAMIQSDGLASSLAFLLAKKKQCHLDAYNHVSNWVVGYLKVQGPLNPYLLKCNSQQYRQAAAEALAYLSWLKRFAEAELG